MFDHQRRLTLQGQKVLANPARGRQPASEPALARPLTAGHVLSNQAAQDFARPCLLRLPTPERCPFGGVCHTCPVRRQTKLKVSQPNDKYEREADRVAEQVMRMPEPKMIEGLTSLERLPNGSIHGASAECGERSRKLLLKEEINAGIKVSNESPQLSYGLPVEIPSLQGGRCLPRSVRAFYEQRLNYDFSQIRIHTNSQAAKSANALGAKAYTIGHDVVFGQGQYAPDGTAGRHLIAHELVHVLQQSSRDVSHPLKLARGRCKDAGAMSKGGPGQIKRKIRPALRVLPLHEPRIQRIIARISIDDDTSREARRQIEEAEELLNELTLDPRRREVLESTILEARTALDAYRRTVDTTSLGMSPMVGGVNTGGTQAVTPLGAIAAVIFALAGWLLVSAGGRTGANEEAAEWLGEALTALSDTLTATINATAIAEMMEAIVASGYLETVRFWLDPGGDFNACFRQFVICLLEAGFQVPEVRLLGDPLAVLPPDLRLDFVDCQEQFVTCMDPTMGTPTIVH